LLGKITNYNNALYSILQLLIMLQPLKWNLIVYNERNEIFPRLRM